MKKTLLIISALAIISLVSKFFHLPGGNMIFTASMAVIALLLAYFSYPLLNGLKIKEAVKSETLKSMDKLSLSASVLLGFCLGMLVIGTLFKLMFWPGSRMIALAGIVGAVVFGGIFLYRSEIKSKTGFYILCFWAVFGAIVYLLPVSSLVQVYYRDSPKYVAAFMEHQEKQTAQSEAKLEYCYETRGYYAVEMSFIKFNIVNATGQQLKNIQVLPQYKPDSTSYSLAPNQSLDYYQFRQIPFNAEFQYQLQFKFGNDSVVSYQFSDNKNEINYNQKMMQITLLPDTFLIKYLSEQ